MFFFLRFYLSYFYFLGVKLERNDPGLYLAAFNAPSEQALKLARYGYASLQAATRLAQM